MRLLVLADHDNRSLASTTARVVGAVQSIATEIDILVAGEGVESVAAQAAKLQGVNKVLAADASHYKYQLAEEMAALIVPLMEHYDGLIAAATNNGKNILPRVAALLDVAQVSDAQAIIAADTFERPIYAGNAIEMVQTSDDKLVLTLRPAAFAPVSGGGSAEITKIPAQPAVGISGVTGQELSRSGRPELTAARIVVAGGRGIGSRENFKRLEQFADRLGAAIGASRAAVDAGFISNDFQIGQTGKIIAPDLYIAVGISGAIQHLAGIRDSRIIVAINKDPEAPIFQIADYGLVGDFLKLLPQLETALDKAGLLPPYTRAGRH